MVVRPPIFIHGILRRSGTNFLNSLILLHDDVVETNSRIRENFFLHHSDSIQDFKNSLFKKWSNPKWKGDDFSEESFDQHLGTALTSFLASETKLHDNATLLTKTPSVQNISHFNKLFPSSKTVIIVRDPRDIAYSAESTWNRPTKKSATEWNAAAIELLNFESNSVTDNHLVIRYEDLVQDPKPQMEFVVEFLGLEASRYGWDKIDKLKVSGSSEFGWSKVDKPKEFSSVGRWSNWSADKLNTLEKTCSQMMQCFGYLASSDSSQELPERTQRVAQFKAIDHSAIKTDYRGDILRRLYRRFGKK